MIHIVSLTAFFMTLLGTVSALEEGESGGIVNGQPVGKCVAGFCLPLKYSSLDPPLIVDENNNTLPNNVNITTDIMDILMVSYRFLSTVIYMIVFKFRGSNLIFVILHIHHKTLGQ